MSRRERRSLIIGVAVVLALGLFVATKLQITSDITSFLPESGDRAQYRLARQLASGDLSRTMILTLGAPDADTAVAASRALERALRSDTRTGPHLAFIDGGPPKQAERAIWELYHQRRFGFAATDVKELEQQLRSPELRESARRLRQQLEQPISPLLTKMAPRDPLLIMPRLLERLERTPASELTVTRGRFLTANSRFAVLFVGTSASAFDSSVQRPFLAGLDAAFDRVNSRFSGQLTLDRSGVNRFAVNAERAIRADIQRVSSLSVAVLGLLLVLLFRSLRLLALASIPIGAGVLAGCAAVLAVYGRMHGVTLAFGASLIGVSFDYVVHLYCHHTVAPAGTSARHTLRTIWKAILTGGATTALGFAVLGASALQGLREVALFATVGIIATLGATHFMLPALIPPHTRPVALRNRVVVWLQRLLAALRRRPKLLWLLPLGALAVVVLGLPHARWNDEFASLGDLDPALLAEDQRVRQRVSHSEQMHFVVALGRSEQAALEVNDAVASTLLAAKDAGELAGFRSLAQMLPSAARQRAISRALRKSPALKRRFEQAFAAEGFVPAAFGPFFDELQQQPAPPLTYADLISSPLAALLRPMRIELDQQVGFITLLQEMRDRDALQQRLRSIKGAVFVQQSEIFGRANRAYQQHTLLLLGVGVLGVLLLLALRYRTARRTFAAILPALLGAPATLAVMALLGYELDLVALTSLLMVVSIGVDYGVFLIDAAASTAGESSLSAALLSVTVAGISTMLGFSLLALSKHPVLHSIGLTAGVGIAACLLLAPAAIVLVGSRDRPSPP